LLGTSDREVPSARDVIETKDRFVPKALSLEVIYLSIAAHESLHILRRLIWVAQISPFFQKTILRKPRIISVFGLTEDKNYIAII
jgi:hypothetical protein